MPGTITEVQSRVSVRGNSVRFSRDGGWGWMLMNEGGHELGEGGADAGREGRQTGGVKMESEMT
jgi:hypothetical protein